MFLKKGIIILMLGCCAMGGFSQVVYERHTNEIYAFLSRMAQKGVLDWDDLVSPVTKLQIKAGLDSVQAHEAALSAVEKKELAFYQREFTEGVRHRILSARGGGFSIDADPVITASYTGGTHTDIKHSSSGINFWGKANDHWAFQFSFQDVNEKGKGLDSFRNGFLAGSATGTVIYKDPQKPNAINFTEIRTSISYAFKHGLVSVGQDYLTWGRGENGKIVLSDKAPVYPYIRFDYQPLPWLRFHYAHAWLQSGLVDSNRSYIIPGGIFSGVREVDISKYMATHSIEFVLKKGLHLSLGESVIYNDNLKIGYLIPIMFFKAFDNYDNRGVIQKGANGQFFAQADSRNQLRNTHLYATLFIDEIRASAIFDKKQARNQLGYTVGAAVTDIGIPYVTAGIEYTRVRAFVYRNFLPAQNYTSSDYVLGDWIGANADRLLCYLKYTPVARLKLLARYQYVRKGSEGTIWQQYYQQPEPDFLFNLQAKQKEAYFSASYEWINRLYLNAAVIKRSGGNNFFSLGMTYGL